jgi:hypothetical protein
VIEGIRYYPSVNDDLPPGGALTFVDGLSVKKLPAVHMCGRLQITVVYEYKYQSMLTDRCCYHLNY